MKLFESNTVARSFYLHVTKAENLTSIRKQGLVPNYNGGNYDDMRWESLNGVYASRYTKQLADYLNAHLITDYIICVIEVDMEAALPDEDTIDIIFDHLFEQMLKVDGLNLRDLEVEEMDPGEEMFESYAARLGEGFHALAATKMHVDYDAETCHEAAGLWLELKLGIDGEAVLVWGDMKEKLVRAYHKMEHPTLGMRHSVRIPSVVGFEGSTRIVGIVHVEGDANPEVVYSNVPPEAQAEVFQMIEDVVYA